MKKQFIIIILAGSTLVAISAKANNFRNVFQKPYRQEVGLAFSGALVGGGLYKAVRSLPKRNPLTFFASVGAIGLGARSSVFVERQSEKPKFFTNERFPRLFDVGRRNDPSVRKDPYGMPTIQRFDKEFYLKYRPHTAVDGIRPFLAKEMPEAALKKVVWSFDKAVEKMEPYLKDIFKD